MSIGQMGCNHKTRMSRIKVFLAEMSSSRSDVVTQFIRVFVFSSLFSFSGLGVCSTFRMS